ncbi:uncharacterized protein BX663DRAFT_486464 [Cokeromyces recurvatus]|uniref:uncharacterized protein n=1 Tax=Cokeromyces recurvatus TaxID=90255 RepID=UPI002220311B|nr:uncharacterized protein BX663DRAFT_486464 [Cokeromyces recurvatus]KAI7902655.1 hypothetical protein BX663DRAFT_486464 [Cokeromyces recurvatus]
MAAALKNDSFVLYALAAKESEAVDGLASPTIMIEDIIKVIRVDEKGELVETHDEIAKSNDEFGENGSPALPSSQGYEFLDKNKEHDATIPLPTFTATSTLNEDTSFISSSTTYEKEKADLSTHIDHESTSTTINAPIAIATNCKTQGQVAVTYGEGPSDATAKIVRQLNQADARANFFVNATWLSMQQYALVVQNTYNAGHFIGMMYRVPGDDSNQLTDEELRQDILNNAYAIETVIQVAPKYVRLHYTEKRDSRTEDILNKLGFVLVGYNLDSQDYNKKDVKTGAGSIQDVYSQTFKKYKDTYDSKGSFIAVQYDLPYTGSLDAVPYIVNTIAEEGYTMVRLDGCLKDPIPYKKSANSTMEYVSDKFSFKQAGYHQGQKPIVLSTTINIPKDDDVKMIAQNIENRAYTSTISLLHVTLIAATIGILFTLFL